MRTICVMPEEQRKALNITVGLDSTVNTANIGRDTVIGQLVWISEFATIGANVTIGKRAEVTRDITVGDNSTIGNQGAVTFNVPANSYVETTFAFGHLNATSVMWTPKGIFIKPGCKKLEPIAATIVRLEKMRETPSWGQRFWFLSEEHIRDDATRMLAWLRKMQDYTVVLA